MSTYAGGYGCGSAYNRCPVDSSTNVRNIRYILRYDPPLAGNPTVTPDGIATAEAVGSPTVGLGTIGASFTGIATAESVGSPTVTITIPVQTITLTGIASVGGVGTPTVSLGSLTAQPGGIASAGAVGTPTATLGAVTASPSGIGSSEAVGSPTVTVASNGTDVSLDGIGSAEAIGSPAVSLAHRVVPVFQPPTIVESVSVVGHRSLLRVPTVVGISVLKVGGQYHQVRQPANWEMDQAEAVYLGGRVYEIDTAEAEALAEAGYADQLTTKLIPV